MTREEMRAEFRAHIERWYPGLVPHEGLLDDLAGTASGYTATQIEKACRPDTRWVPGKQRRERKRSA